MKVLKEIFFGGLDKKLLEKLKDEELIKIKNKKVFLTQTGKKRLFGVEFEGVKEKDLEPIENFLEALLKNPSNALYAKLLYKQTLPLKSKIISLLVEHPPFFFSLLKIWKESEVEEVKEWLSAIFVWIFSNPLIKKFLKGLEIDLVKLFEGSDNLLKSIIFDGCIEWGDWKVISKLFKKLLKEKEFETKLVSWVYKLLKYRKKEFLRFYEQLEKNEKAKLENVIKFLA